MKLNSRQRRQSDERSARDAVYETRGKGLNPFEEGSRKHKMWNRWKRHFDTMEMAIGEMEEAYGPVERQPHTK